MEAAITSARQIVATAMIGVAVRNPSPGRNGVVMGIEQGVGDVDQQVDQDVDEGGQKDHPLDHGIIAPQHGVDGEASDARQVEHALGDNDARD